MAAAYDLDLHARTLAQADALRRRSPNDVDWENIAEEMESLGKQQVAELRSRLEVLLVNLLKWAWRPELRAWLEQHHPRTAKPHPRARDREPEPQVRRRRKFLRAYAAARFQASTETEIDVDLLPQVAPFTLDQAQDEAFWPEPVTVEPPRG